MFAGDVSIDSVPGLASLVAKFYDAKAQFLAVPLRVRNGMDRLAKVQAIATSGGAASALTKIPPINAAFQSVQRQWDAAAAGFQTIDAALHGGSGVKVSLSTVTSILGTVPAVTSIFKNIDAAEAQLATLAGQTISPEEYARIFSASPTMTVGSLIGGTTTWMYLALALGGVYVLSRRRRRA